MSMVSSPYPSLCTSSTIVQFQCDAGNNGDRVYLDVDGSYEIGVVDLLGRQLLQEQRTQTAGEQFFKIPTADWPEGTYILYLRSKDGSAARRFIIQR